MPIKRRYLVERKRQRPWTAQDDATLIRLHAELHTAASIGVLMKRARQLIYHHHQRLGLTPHASEKHSLAANQSSGNTGNSGKLAMNGPPADRGPENFDAWHKRAKRLLGDRLTKYRDCWHIDGQAATVQQVIAEANRFARPGERIGKL